MLLLRTKLRKKLLAYSFTHADENYYVRELASYIHGDPGNLSRELRKLESEGLYKSVIRGKVKLYSLDKSYPLFSEFKAILFKTEGVFGTLKELVSGYKDIILAFIYGSYAKNRENASSDIDIVVVGDFDRDAFTEELRKLEARLSREINFNAYTKEEFYVERKKHGGFLNLVLKEKILLLKGKL
jgi:predicted nucleotidyltransferase